MKGYRATHTHGTEAITLASDVAHHAGKNARIALAALDECKVYGRAFRRAVNAIQAATSDEATGAKALERARLKEIVTRAEFADNERVLGVLRALGIVANPKVPRS